MAKRIVNEQAKIKMAQRKYNVPVIGHFQDKKVRFNSIIEASNITGLHYHSIFEAAVGKITQVCTPGTNLSTYWEFEDGKDWIKYKAYYVRQQRRYMRYESFNG